MGRLLDEDVVIKEIASWREACKDTSHFETASDLMLVIKSIKDLPSVQPEPSILLSWVEKYIEWLKGLDNEFANLAAAHISVMVKKWRDEQNERTD